MKVYRPKSNGRGGVGLSGLLAQEVSLLETPLPWHATIYMNNIFCLIKELSEI